MHYTRKITSFAVDPTETMIYAGTASGLVLSIPVDAFEIRHETRGHGGGIESIAVHAKLPYMATLAIDATVCLWDVSTPAAPRELQTIPLRAIRSAGYEGVNVAPLACPLAFHPTERRLLTHNADAALAEIAFDDHSYQQLWTAGLFLEEQIAYDIDYVRYLVDSDYVFASTFGGHVAVVDPKRPNDPVFRFRYDQRTIHCATHVAGSEYLLASDTRRVLRFDATGQREPEVGPPVVRDHLEQISYNKTSQRVFASSFDRTVVEIDRDTLQRKAVVLETPFKLRWLHSFERNPNLMLVQCRNGALYLADLAQKRCVGVVKDTPNALWTAVRSAPDMITIAGEGPEMLELRASSDPKALHTDYTSTWAMTPGTRGSYAKRIVRHEPTDSLLHARSDGRILWHKSGTISEFVRLSSPLRDIATSPEGFDLFAVTEDGRAHRIDLETGRTLCEWKTEEEPLWSLAYNHERRLLAVCERQGSLIILNADDLTEQFRVSDSWAPKRMKWADADRLLIGRGAELYELDLVQHSMRRVIEHVGNTIEDFAWDDERRFIAVCSYGREVGIYDFKTWLKLDSVDFDLDYPKGLVWLGKDRSPGAHPYEFLVFGRSGIPIAYRVHDECLHKLGPVSSTHSTPILDSAGVQVP